MPPALLISYSHQTGTVKIHTKFGQGKHFPTTPEGMMSLARFLQALAPIGESAPLPDTAPLPALSPEEAASHPAYQKFLYPSPAHGVRHSPRRTSLETLTRIMEDFTLEGEE